jgi:hypothetical protein
MPYLYIELNHDFKLVFRILETTVAQAWLDRMNNRGQYPLDHPDRFYGFDTAESEIERAVSYIQNCISTINAHKKIIHRSFDNIHDQDCLNYLHNIFEQYHGLLDQQDTDFWNTCPISVRQALADLNLAVHRCESVTRIPRPRFVCTWFGLPKTERIATDLISTYGQLNPKFGSVCLNYVEIGKTLEDLVQDNDKYIADDAFKPFDYYSADFVVRFYELTKSDIDTKLNAMKQYFCEHYDFFQSRGYTTFDDPRLLPYRIPVAELETDICRDQLMKLIQTRQNITRIYIK